MHARREFDYDLDFHRLDFRRHPEQYRVGRGEQGAMLVEPYKSELLPVWRFQSPALARRSAEALYVAYLHYKKTQDFVGMDMVRKYLQMGYTRSRRYANFPAGKKRGRRSRRSIEGTGSAEKAQAAWIFRRHWMRVRRDPVYVSLLKRHLAHFG